MRNFKYLFIGALLAAFSTVASVNAAYVKDSDLTAESTVATGDTIPFYDTSAGNTMKTTVANIFASAANVGASTIVTTGALDTGSITSGFGAIDNGASAIDTSGVITGGTVEAASDTSSGDNSAIGYTSAEGCIVTGQGSTYDVTIKNDADAVVAGVPTGTVNLSMPAGTLIVADGGTVTQATNKATGVTLNTYSGQITTDNASLAGGAEVTFTVTNSVVTALDVVMLSIADSPDADSEIIAFVNDVASGTFDILLSNVSANADTGAIVINYVVFRGASS